MQSIEQEKKKMEQQTVGAALSAMDGSRDISVTSMGSSPVRSPYSASSSHIQ
jgi:hypothetical protein